MVANVLLDAMGDASLTVIWALVTLSGLLTVAHRFVGIPLLKKNEKLDKLFSVTGFWFLVRMIGLVFANMIYFDMGPELIIGDLTGGVVIFDLMPILGVGGILLPWGGIALILGNLKMGIGIIVLYLIIAAVRNSVEPRIVGKEIGLHPLATLVAMVVGLRLAGLVGMMMLPISLVAIVKLREGSLNEQVY